MLFSVFVLLWPNQAAQGQELNRDEFPPPYGVAVDVSANTVSWRQPGDILLLEDFESGNFPPEGWTATSAGKGWRESGIGPFQAWIVPETGSDYAFSNDDSASAQNNGSLDMLISPVLDLTSVDSCRLTFRSYFTGAYGQAASVKYRLSASGLWTELGTPPADFSWIYDTLDLTAFSGPEGESYFQLAFHADDRGNHASGWAIDNVEVFGKILSLDPVDYLLFWDGQLIDSITGFLYPLPFSYYGEDHQFGICARYQAGNSDTILLEYESKNLPPPENLDINLIINNFIILEWSPPYHPPYCDPFDLQFVFETESADVEGGSETDGEFIYVCYQNSQRIDKYDLQGNLLEVFVIPGIPGLFDLAYDPESEYMYGGHGGTTIYIMDFVNKVKIGQFTAPVEVRGLAYSPWEMVFYANNISSDITVFEEGGDSLRSFPVGDIGNYYGLAMDWWGYGNNLWGFSRDSTGRLLVEYNVESGQRTGRTVDVSPLSENNGLACGLFISYDLAENCVTLGGNLQNDIVFGYSLRELLPYGWSPPGVDHYILYNQDTVIYANDFTSYYYNQPDYLDNSYKFEVSAWYDLTEFGYPGEYAESSKNGPVYLNDPIPPQSGLELNFIERWQSETFTENSWDTLGEGWSVHPNLGNPSPTAVFRGIGIPDNYDGKLTSDWFNVKHGDSCNVILVFDLKILDYFPTGLQTMAIEAYDMIDQTWREVRAYHNDTMMLNFVSDSLLLSPYVFDDRMKFRFHTYGIDAEDVGYWMMDNIRVEYTCIPPWDLLAEPTEDQDSILVSWQHQYSGSQQMMHYDDSVKFIETGFDSGPENWYDIAAKWESSNLHDLDNSYFMSMAFIPTMTEASYVLKIWSGEEAGNLIFEKIVTDYVPGEWNTVELDPPVAIDVLSDLWIGYSCSSRGGTPLSMDQGPALDGYGNLIRIDSEWTTMLSVNPALDYNFNIQALLERPPGHVEAFQVFRSIGSGPFQHIATTGSSSIMLPSESLTEEQCFRSRIVCFNEPGMIVVSGFSDTDCVLPVFTEEADIMDNEIRVYPNPTDGSLYIESVLEIERVELFDIDGRLMYSSGKNGSNFNINLESSKPGIYLLRLYTSSGFEDRKIVLLP